jgi:hypothetical protein
MLVKKTFEAFDVVNISWSGNFQDAISKDMLNLSHTILDQMDSNYLLNLTKSKYKYNFSEENRMYLLRQNILLDQADSFHSYPINDLLNKSENLEI